MARRRPSRAHGRAARSPPRAPRVPPEDDVAAAMISAQIPCICWSVACARARSRRSTCPQRYPPGRGCLRRRGYLVARLDSAVEAVARLAARAREHGADPVLLIATAAVRDAANAGELATAIRAHRPGMQTIGGEREAALPTAAPGRRRCGDPAGLRRGRRQHRGDPRRGRPVTLQTSLPIGSSRLARQFTSDPPAAADGPGLRRGRPYPGGRAGWRPERLIVTGGTATALAQVAGGSGAALRHAARRTTPYSGEHRGTVGG